jgi:acetylornithine deacetylase/succinyl-diaminopimelate desuccinylase-like protein
MYKALEAAGRRLFNVPSIPYLMTGATDMAQLRAKGVQAYGTGPASTAEEGPLGGAHTDDERISIASLMSLMQWTWESVIAIAAK